MLGLLPLNLLLLPLPIVPPLQVHPSPSRCALSLSQHIQFPYSTISMPGRKTRSSTKKAPTHVVPLEISPVTTAALVAEVAQAKPRHQEKHDQAGTG